VSASWPALDAARRLDATRRIAFELRDPATRWLQRVGSVARAHLGALARFPVLSIDSERVALVASGAERSDRWAEINLALREQGLLVGWRDEAFPVRGEGDEILAVVERAAARFYGLLTWAAHANGYVADAAGRPTHLWIAERSAAKATDPGKLDNLVGGGVPIGQTPRETLLREGQEEAGLRRALTANATCGATIELHRDVPEGVQHERVFVHDLALPIDFEPRNRDGEVAAFRGHPIDEALEIAASGAMTVDAELVTLDFALRHRLLDARAESGLTHRLAALCHRDTSD
jgi:8-oxo-dGTP pyrophosphatase MutT (NUDIX family)